MLEGGEHPQPSGQCRSLCSFGLLVPPPLNASLPPSLPWRSGYVAAGLDKKEMSFEVDEKILG
jgi:hypothetical protein